MAEHDEIHEYDYLDQLNTEELEELLHADIESLESSDDDVIFHIIEVIEKREKAHPTGRLPDVDKSWEDFQKYYNIPEGAGLSLYPNEGQNDLQPIMCEPTSLKATRNRCRSRRVLISVAAAICIVVITIPPAMGYASVFQMIGHWTAEQFNFSEASESPKNDSQASQTEGEYASLQDALNQHGISDAVVPQWIPDGFQLQEIWIQEYSGTGDVEFSAPYVNGNDNIIITIVQHNGQFDKSYEKNGQDVEQYMSGNIEHYIFHNNNNITDTWYVNSLECSISTTLSVTQLEKIIDSIYKE